MKQCKCGNLIGDQYTMCISCLNQSKQQNTDSTTLLLKQINWNLGAIAKQQRLYYLGRLLSLRNNVQDYPIFNEIITEFSKDLSKDIKQLNEIRKEGK